jgi:hypothetical protein
MRRTQRCTPIVLSLLCACGGAVRTDTIPIAAARTQPLGSVVSVAGTATVSSGAFKSGTSDDGFAVQDPSGGIYVSESTQLNVAMSSAVSLTGTLGQSHELLVITPPSADSVQRRGPAPLPTPRTVRTADVGPTVEGLLVRVSGTVVPPVRDDPPYGRLFHVDDGSGAIQVFVYASTSVDVSGLQVGQQVDVIGFAGRFDAIYEVWPRVQGDIHAAQ